MRTRRNTLKLGVSSTGTDCAPSSVASAAWALDMVAWMSLFLCCEGLNRLFRVKLGG